VTAETFRYLGGPGTGKTQTLLACIQHERDENDLKLQHLAFCSFTRSQRDDVRSRIAPIFPESTANEIRRQVRTLHGLALSGCLRSGHIPEITKNNNPIITEGKTTKPYVEFCEEHHLAYRPNLGIQEPGDEPSHRHDLPVGNVLFDISRYITQQFCWTPENWLYAAQAKGYTRLPNIPDVPSALRDWERFKIDNGLYEHDDYVNLAVRNRVIPPVLELFIDEFQDLTPAQYMLYRIWCDSPIERIYIAGDPDQSIYGFRGADPVYLTQTRATDQGETPISHRCPAEIVRVAGDILQKPPIMKPRGPGGIVSAFEPRNADEVSLSVMALYEKYGEVLIVSRFQKYMRRIGRQLSAAGIPVTGLSPGKVYGWETVRTTECRRPADMAVILELLRQVDDYSKDARSWEIAPKKAAKLINASTFDDPEKAGFIKQLTGRESVFLEELVAAFGISPDDSPRPAATLISHLDFAETILKNLTAALENRILPGAVRVDTIHAAKGLEAPAVIVDCRYLPGRREGYFRQNEEKEKMRAEERRVYYVAATRASEALYFMDFPQLRAPALQGVLADV